MVYYAAGCNQEPVPAIVAQIVSLYCGRNDWRASLVQLMYGSVTLAVGSHDPASTVAGNNT